MNEDRLNIRRADMKCSGAARYMSPYVDGEMQAKDQARLENHFAQCPHCTEVLEQTKALSGLFAQAERFRAPLGFSAKVMDKIESKASVGFIFWPVFTRFAGAAAVLLAITAGVMSGVVMFDYAAPQRQGVVVSALSLETYETLPPDSLGSAYLTVAEERQ
jgi:anti-sigma factor RsiW